MIGDWTLSASEMRTYVAADLRDAGPRKLADYFLLVENALV